MTISPTNLMLELDTLEHDDGDGGDGGGPPINPADLLPILSDVLDKIKARGPFFAAAVKAAWREVGAEHIPESMIQTETEETET